MNKIYSGGSHVMWIFVPALFPLFLMFFCATLCAGGESVPDVSFLELDNAHLKMEGASFVLGTVTYECDDTVPKGSVIKQTPAAGTVVDAAIPVDVVVSTGGCDCCGGYFCSVTPRAIFLGVLAVLVLILLAVFWGGDIASPAGLFK